LTNAWRVSLAVVLICGAVAARAAGQTVVPPRGTGTVSLTFENYHHSGHFDKVGHKNTNGATESKVFLTQVDFGVTDTIGLNVSLPFVASKYTGPDVYYVEGIETHPGPLDDRTYHGAFQDLRFEGRRMFLAGPVAMMPFVAGSIPTHHYQTRGEAVPGRYRRGLQLGVNTETALDAVLPHLYLHAKYAYEALQRIDNFPHTSSNIELEPGYVATSRIDIRSLVSWEIAHKGPTVAQLRPDWINHDRFINSNYLNVGAGTSFWLTQTLEIYAVWIQTVRGDHGAHVARTLAFGVNRSFGGGGLPTLGR